MAYGTDTGLEDWLASIGATDFPGTADLTVARVNGSNYIDAVYGARFKGVPTGGVEQLDAWPRTGVRVYGQMIPSDTGPVGIVAAAYRAAYLIATGQITIGATAEVGSRIKRQKVDGAAEREFFAERAPDIGRIGVQLDPIIDGLMAPYLIPVSEGLQGIWAIGR